MLRIAVPFIGIPFCRAGSSLHKMRGIHDFGPLEPVPGDTLPDGSTILHVIPVTREDIIPPGVDGVVPEGHLRKLVLVSPCFSQRKPNPHHR